jgi:hypothetical protein
MFLIKFNESIKLKIFIFLYYEQSYELYLVIVNTSIKVSKKEEEVKNLDKKKKKWQNVRKKIVVCFDGFINHKCLLCIYIAMIFIFLAVVTIISIMILILMAYGNRQEEICQIRTSNRLLSNGEISEIIPPKKEIINCLSE